MTADRSNLVELYRRMAELTLPECSAVCRVPYSCCSREYCQLAKSMAAEKGITLEETGHPTLPFMGPSGCVLEPHLRPLCALHTCEINSLGFKAGDPRWTRKYFALRGKIEEAHLEELEKK